LPRLGRLFGWHYSGLVGIFDEVQAALLEGQDQIIRHLRAAPLIGQVRAQLLEGGEAAPRRVSDESGQWISIGVHRSILHARRMPCQSMLPNGNHGKEKKPQVFSAWGFEDQFSSKSIVGGLGSRIKSGRI
jgi:hypothetical protein